LFFQHDRGFSFSQATMISAMVPMGWVIGCPLLGWLSDLTDSRKMVILGGCTLMIVSLLQLLYIPTLWPAHLSMLLMGIGSGAAMIPYSIIKEVNPDEVKGSATGAINFITFSVTSLLGPLFASRFGKTLSETSNQTAHFNATGLFLIGLIAAAMVITLFLREKRVKAI